MMKPSPKSTQPNCDPVTAPGQLRLGRYQNPVGRGSHRRSRGIEVATRIKRVRRQSPGEWQGLHGGFATISTLSEALLIGLLMCGVLWLISTVIQPPNSARESAMAYVPIFRLVALSNGHQLFARRGVSEIVSVDLDTREKRIVYGGGQARIVGSQFSNDGATRLLLTDDQVVMIFRDNALLVSQNSDDAECALSANGATAVVVTRGTKVRCWDISGPEPTWTEYQIPESLNRIALDPKGETLVVCTRSGAVELYEAKTGALWKTLAIVEQAQCDPLFFPDGKHLAISGRESVTVIDVRTGELVWKTHRGAADFLVNMAVSADGRFVAVGGCKVGIQILDGSRGDVLHKFSVDEIVNTMTFSHSGDVLYVGTGSCRSIRVWSVSSGKELNSLEVL